ncbi:MAG: PQQ-binding-like beta-propeller repeat protein [Thermoproteota archaeon]|nr:PQQ-binding-like beta-propeller repeat protein [Thermoproteota archaeon]
MKINKSIISIALILTLTLSSFGFISEAAVVNVETRLFISAVPTPVGVGQTVNIQWWLTIPHPVAGKVWENIKVTIEDPDGKVTTYDNLMSDINGGAYISFTPNIVGTYKVQASFPGQWVNTTGSSGYTRWYIPLESKVLEVTVQEEQITVTPELPMPTEYWTRPINAENRQWYQISGNWLMGKGDKDAVAYEGSGNANPYSTAPNTGHIMWTKPLLPGGIVGGQIGWGEAYYGGLNYEAMFRPPIIINGILYYETAQQPRYGQHAVDLRTGEEIWYKNYSYGSGFNALKLGQVLDFDSMNQHGSLAYLWFAEGSTWHMHDAFTGNYILSVGSVPSGYIQTGPKGEILIYTVNNAQGWVQLWNSSQIPDFYTSSNPYSDPYNQWRPERNQGKTINGTGGIQWKVTVPTVNGGGNSVQWLDEKIGVMITTATRQTANDPWPTFVHAAYSTETGQFLWTQNRTNIGDMKYPVYIKPYTGIYTLPYREQKQWIAWDMATGKELWRADGPEDDWGIFDVGGGFVGDVFYTAGFAGIVTGYDTKTGAKVWEFYSGSSGFDTTYGTWGFYGASIIADGKIFIPHNEHSPDQPLWRGMKLWAINATTGEGIWNISGAYQGGRNAMGALADGFLVTHNAMDNQIYVFGKGPSATTVTASPKVTTHGSSVIIEGTVLDIAAGTQQNEQKARFPNGVPVVSDESMTPWMEYVYMQKPKPTDVTGVVVELFVIDANNNYRSIGMTTTGESGFYSYQWTPDVPGKYTVYAKFTGSESYWPSQAVTAFAVDEAEATPSPTETPPSTVEQYFWVAVAAIIVAIAIGFALTILLLRKKQ